MVGVGLQELEEREAKTIEGWEDLTQPIMYIISKEGVVEAYGFDERRFPQAALDVVGKNIADIYEAEDVERMLQGISTAIKENRWIERRGTLHLKDGLEPGVRMIFAPDTDNTAAVYCYYIPKKRGNVIDFAEKRAHIAQKRAAMGG
jgi:hypothetical protein